MLDATTHQSSLPQVFFGGDAAFGPKKNIITAVAMEPGRRSQSTACCTART
ncbi:MAG: hypothetical protein U1E77_04850 [Inhella sp.]